MDLLIFVSLMINLNFNLNPKLFESFELFELLKLTLILT